MSDAANEDPDLLEVLSLCDDNNEGNELDLMLDMEQYENQSSKGGRLMDVSFGTDSSSSKLSTDHDEDSGVVVLRSKDRFGYGSYTDRSAFSLPHGSGYRTIHKFSPKDSNNNNSSVKEDCPQCSQTLPFQKRSKSAIKDLDTPKAVQCRPFCLPIQDSYQNMADLPSPSSASLHSGRMHHKYDSFLQDMSAKSSSAPLLMKKDKVRDNFIEQKTVSNLAETRTIKSS